MLPCRQTFWYLELRTKIASFSCFGPVLPYPEREGMMQGLLEIVPVVQLLGLGGIGIFLVFSHLGFKNRLDGLADYKRAKEEIADGWKAYVQERDEYMQKRAAEFTAHLQALDTSWRQMDETRQRSINHLLEHRDRLECDLKRARSESDEDLARFRVIELEQLELMRRSMELIPQLEGTLRNTIIHLSQLGQLLGRSVPLHELPVLAMSLNADTRRAGFEPVIANAIDSPDRTISH
jgi:hypothetical protein